MKKLHGLMLASCALSAVRPGPAFADLNFDATTVEPDAGFDALPIGWYNANITGSEMKPTNDGLGTYLKLEFTILDGQYASRKVWTQLNLKNSNQQTVEIAQKQLSAICHAVNVLKPAKSEELHAKPLKIKLGYKAGDGTYEASNPIKSYKNINEQVDMAGGDAAKSGAGGAAFGAADGAAAAPWEKGGAAEAAAADPAPAAAADKAPPPPPATEAPPPPPAAHDPMAAAVADGWIAHPTAPGYHYKGNESKLDADVAALYPAPPPAAPAAGDPPPPPPAAGAGDPPPWAKG